MTDKAVTVPIKGKDDVHHCTTICFCPSTWQQRMAAQAKLVEEGDVPEQYSMDDEYLSHYCP